MTVYAYYESAQILIFKWGKRNKGNKHIINLPPTPEILLDAYIRAERDGINKYILAGGTNLKGFIRVLCGKPPVYINKPR